MQNTFQNSFMSLWFTFKKKIRAKEFLEQMDKVITVVIQKIRSKKEIQIIE